MHLNLYEIVLKSCVLVDGSKLSFIIFERKIWTMFGGGTDLIAHCLFPQISGMTWKMCSFHWKSFVKQVFNNEAANRHVRPRKNFQILY